MCMLPSPASCEVRFLPILPPPLRHGTRPRPGEHSDTRHPVIASLGLADLQRGHCVRSAIATLNRLPAHASRQSRLAAPLLAQEAFLCDRSGIVLQRVPGQLQTNLEESDHDQHEESPQDSGSPTRVRQTAPCHRSPPSGLCGRTRRVGDSTPHNAAALSLPLQPTLNVDIRLRAEPYRETGTRNRIGVFTGFEPPAVRSARRVDTKIKAGELVLPRPRLPTFDPLAPIRLRNPMLRGRLASSIVASWTDRSTRADGTCPLGGERRSCGPSPCGECMVHG